jgi:pseudouridine kinase
MNFLKNNTYLIFINSIEPLIKMVYNAYKPFRHNVTNIYKRRANNLRNVSDKMSEVLVIGKVFVDIKGSSFAPPHKDAKNVGTVNFSNGGTGRNVAQNMAALGTKTTFVTSITNDPTGKGVVEELENYAVNTSSIHWVEENGMGMWVAILDNNGDLVTSISHQPDEKHIANAVYLKLDRNISNYDAVAIDLDLPLPVIKSVIEECHSKQIPIFGLAAHLDEIKDEITILTGLSGFICNKEEAEILMNSKITSTEDALTAAKTLAKTGAPITIVTLSEKGCVYADENEQVYGHVPTNCVQVVDSTGAGDAFFSGTVTQLVEGKKIEEAIELGMQVAQQVISCKENALTSELVHNIVVTK